MGFGAAIASGFRNYAKGRGRATRSEFWYWTLFVFLVGIAASAVDVVLASVLGLDDHGAFNSLTSLALLIPGIAVTIRRLHDTDRSGWWYLLPLTIIGIIPFVIWVCSRGTPGANRFGLGTQADIASVFGGPAQPPAFPASAPSFAAPPFPAATATEREEQARGSMW